MCHAISANHKYFQYQKQVLALGIKVLCGKKVSKDSALSTHVGPSILKMSSSIMDD